jgi:hypothetical protein
MHSNRHLKGYYNLELQRINELLAYNPLTGEIQSKEVGRKIAPDAEGFITIWDSTIKKKTKFKADRLCWTLGNNKKLRKNQKILHLNLSKTDNRLPNLRVVPSSVFNKVNEAAKNLGGALKITPHLTDKYNFVVSYFKDKVQKKEIVCDITNAQQRLIMLQLQSAKILTKYCIFD